MSKQLKLPTLLVIADNPSIRFWVKKHLDDQFFILNAETKGEALEALNTRLDFIIIDSELETDALELCKEISGIAKKNLIPILLITGRLKKSYRDRATESGVTGFLSDQLDPEELTQRIAEGVKTATARQKTEELALGIKVPKTTPNGSLKKKFFLTDQALRLLAAAKREQIPLTLLLLRIDPHPEEIAQFIKGFLRENDVLIPMEKGTFIWLLWDTTPDGARNLAEKLRAQIKKPYTVSIAISSLEATEKGFNQMIDAASKSLKVDSIISIDPEAP